MGYLNLEGLERVWRHVRERCPRPNLICNSNLAAPVNPAGEESYLAGEEGLEAIPGWVIPYRTTMTLVDGGVCLSSSGGGMPSMSQAVELDSGTVYTVSARINGEIVSASGAPQDFSSPATLSLSEDKLTVLVDNGDLIEWVKLEKGDCRTIFVPENRAAAIWRASPAESRDRLGLGKTTGALPIANGGTGATSGRAALNALGLYCESKIFTTDSSGRFSETGLLSGNGYPIFCVATVGGGGNGWVKLDDPAANKISGIVYRPDGTVLPSSTVRINMIYGTSWPT